MRKQMTIKTPEDRAGVYNHAFAFPELVAIPATKRGNGGVSTKLSGYRTNTSQYISSHTPKQPAHTSLSSMQPR